MSGKDVEDTDFAHTVEKSKIAKSGDWNLSGDRYKSFDHQTSKWTFVELQNLCSFANGLWKGKKGKLEEIAILRSTNFRNDGYLDLQNVAQHQVEKAQLKSRLLQYGDILLERSGGGPTQPVGRVVFFNLTVGNYSFSNFTTRIRTTDKRILPQFLWLILLSLYKSGITEKLQKRTSGIRNLDFQAYKLIRIPLPPLDVQKAIVAEIDGYQKIIDGARQVVDNYKPTIKIDPDWPIVALGEVVKVNAMTIDPSVKYGEKEFVYIDITSVENGTGVISFDNRIKGIDAPSRARRVIRNGDVLLSTVRPNLKAFGYLSDVPENSIASTGFAVLTATNKVVPQFVYYQLFGEYLQEQMIDRMGKGAYPSINQKDVQELEIPLPPLSVQQEIVAQIEAEQQIVNANKKLIEMYEQKIKDKIAEVWVCGTSQAAVRATTPYKDDAAVICLLLAEMEKLHRPTTEFFIQKHIFVTKHHLHLPVNSVFKRKVAGPWSQELRWKAIEAAIKMNWLRWQKNRLVAGSAFEKALNHAAIVLGEHATQLAQLVKNLKGFGNNGLERWTTVLKVVEDLKETQQPITQDNIQREINSWPGKSLKEIFAEESVDYTITMMLKHKWLPTSAGQ